MLNLFYRSIVSLCHFSVSNPVLLVCIYISFVQGLTPVDALLRECGHEIGVTFSSCKWGIPKLR